jgi:hypothetical protein
VTGDDGDWRKRAVVVAAALAAAAVAALFFLALYRWFLVGVFRNL